VYAVGKPLFFEDYSSEIIDDVFYRLQTFPNVRITGHEGFLTQETIQNIASTRLENIILRKRAQSIWSQLHYKIRFYEQYIEQN
jgi:phosphoglycerate dehydrogenase-like enzyme